MTAHPTVAAHLEEAITALRQDPHLGPHVVGVFREPAQPPRFGPWPARLAPDIRRLWEAEGIRALYTHQSAALEHLLAGKDVLLITPTASGKSLAFWGPVLHLLITDPHATALCLFPTKALTQDQYARLRRWLERLGRPEWAGIYDGDTPPEERRRIRQHARVLLTNPDMLHRGLLPRHPRWAEFWRGLRLVVLDEIHTYRGIFGAHVANVLRRLFRIAAFYGTQPQVAAASATVGNPADVAVHLLGRRPVIVQDSGAPRPPRVLLFYNPPLIDPNTGLRRSSLLDARDIARHFLRSGLQTLLFARSRRAVELLLTYLREDAARIGLDPHALRSYRGGFLPRERRAIETGLRNGTVRGVAATNALELGVDIGSLEAVILVGYPGTVASAHQQWGRAGRRESGGIGVFVAGPGALDQYIVHHPEFLLQGRAEHVRLAPDNLYVLLDHLRCALFELPMRADEPLGTFADTQPLLDFLVELGEVRHAGNRYYWLGADAPADRVSLRTTRPERVVIAAVDGATTRTLGDVDWDTAPLLVHPDAIYLHDGVAYRVREVDWESGRAWVEPAQTDYYTQPVTRETLTVLHEMAQQERQGTLRAWGEVRIQSQVVGYRMVRWESQEVLGYRDVDVPPREMETTAYWLAFTADLLERLRAAGVWRSDTVEDYGPNWAEQRRRALERDGYRCRRCGAPHRPDRPLHVHHIRPFRTFGYIPGENEAYREANRLENLITLCPRCHRLAEATVRLRTGFNGVAYLVRFLAPLFVMTDPGDLGSVVEVQSPHTGLPTITLYDNVPGGIGLAERLYEVHDALLAAALARVRACPCRYGCPACVGPVLVEEDPTGANTKALTLALLKAVQPK